MPTNTEQKKDGKPLLLIVDDDPLIADTLSIALRDAFEIITSHSRPQALQLLHQLRQPPALALVDLGLPPLPHRPDEGFSLITELLTLAPAIRIVVLSGQNDEANARHARTLGAADFVGKPCHPKELRQLLDRMSLFSATEPRATNDARPTLIGKSLPMEKLRAQIAQYAESPFPVLIEGESGSGKEIVARCLHFATTRHHRPFLALNCAAISPSLVEPTLFGHAKGAFTGASGSKAGYFEEAGDGTLFLDEIGELPLELQAKLLRVLENGDYQRVGETQTRRSRARVVTATNRDLRREIRDGHFRTDLYHRLSVFSIGVPALRDMGEDKFLLLDYFRKHYAQLAAQKPFDLAPAAKSAWLSYPFPGNVRELRNVVIRLTAKHAGALVTPDDLAQELDLPDDFQITNALPASSDGRHLDAATQRLQSLAPFNLDAELSEMERAYIDAALSLTQGNVSQAARMLGINRTTLYSRMEAAQATRLNRSNIREH
ncbi:MAG: sigma-54-dependent Fis family transcriptional regulator [Zoogloeaceae bacterium]|nr:sigma-54-dependent Fis family transcriptional regulator [Zoogloeaceae bacterium]